MVNLREIDYIGSGQCSIRIGKERAMESGEEMQVKTQQSRSSRMVVWRPQGGGIIEFRMRTNFKTRVSRRALIVLLCLSNPKCL